MFPQYETRLSLLVLLLLYCTTVFSQTNPGLEIAIEMDARETGFQNFSAEMTMVLLASSGRRTERKLRVRTREVDGDGDQSLAIFDSPADVRGTAFLSHTHIGRDDDQWLYLPALKRVKRISPSNKTAPFMGSEFSYEDLASSEIENFTYRYVGEQTFAGTDCFVIDRIPAYEYSGYSRQRTWVDKLDYKTLKVEYYDHRNELEKTLLSTNFEQYLDRFWYARKMTMENHLSGKVSELYWDNFRFREPMGDSDFSPNSLSRMR